MENAKNLCKIWKVYKFCALPFGKNMKLPIFLTLHKFRKAKSPAAPVRMKS